MIVNIVKATIKSFKKINIKAKIKFLEIIRLVPDHLKTKKLHDQCKTQKFCNKAVLENGGTLKFVPDNYKN